MRILITGGAGFLGSHLCELLINKGHHVIAMDNLITGRVDNITDLMGHSRFTFVKYNVCDYVHVDGALDAILHFASPASRATSSSVSTLPLGFVGRLTAIAATSSPTSSASKSM